MKPTKEQILAGRALGLTDKQRIDALITLYGSNVAISPGSPMTPWYLFNNGRDSLDAMIAANRFLLGHETNKR